MKKKMKARKSNIDLSILKPGRRWNYGLISLLVLFVSLLMVTDRVATAAANVRDVRKTHSKAFSKSVLSVDQADPQAAQTCSANGNPFGNFHNLFVENEVFISTSSTGGFAPNVTAFLLDQGMPQGTHTTLTEEWLYYEETNPNGFGMVSHAATAVDLDGNGESEFVQTFLNSNNEWYLAYYDSPQSATITPSYYKVSSYLYNPVVAASGQISKTNSLQEQAVLAGVDRVSGKVNVMLWDGANKNGAIQIQGRWSSTSGGRQNSSLLDIAVGDFDGDSDDDIAVLMKQNDGDLELVVLVHDPAYNQGSGDNVEFRLKVLANVEFNSGSPSSIRVVGGRLNADYRDDIVVIFNDGNADDQLIKLFAFKMETAENSPIWSLKHYNEFNTNIAYKAGRFTMAAGMGEIDGDYLRDEIVIGYPAADGLHFKVFGAQGLDGKNPTMGNLYDWSTPWSAGDDRIQAQYLDIEVGNLNNDGPGEIVASFDDGRGLEVLYLNQENLNSNTLTATLDLDPQSLNTPTSIALGDANNDSIRAVYSGKCRVVEEENINSVIYRPPLWENIQQPSDAYGKGFVGSSTGSGASVERKMAIERTTATSGYIGVGVSAEYGVASFEASAKFTMSEEYSQGSSNGTGSSSHVTDSIEYSSYYNFAVADQATYYCYGYDIVQHGSPITDTTSMRSCELDLNESFRNTDTLVSMEESAAWETSPDQALEWVPAARDWASMGLLCTNCTNQSSTDGGGTAGRAVDGILDGQDVLMTSTNVENYPWWELDLGDVEEIRKIRIWHNDLESCQKNNTCTDQLKDFYVFVSTSPFSATDTPADLLSDPNVESYSFGNISEPLSTTVGTDFPAGRVTTFLTLERIPGGRVQAINGQYIRVQINRTNAELNLAEVQVFGSDHVEPDKYPIAVKPGGNGYFEVQVHNPYDAQNPYKWIQVRGDLLWDGRKNDGNLVTISVPKSPGMIQWSRLNDKTTTEFTSGTIEETKSVGMEFDLSAGAIVLAQAGYGKEWSSSVFSETTHTTSWTQSFELGGLITGFPHGIGVNLKNLCEYKIQPYYYQLTEESSFGYQTTYTVLDYIVSDHLDRTSNLRDCLLGHAYAPTSNASGDEASGNAASSILVHAMLNDAGTENLRITSVDDPPHGSASFTNAVITYVPDAGFIGKDTFSYVIGDGVTSSTGTVIVTVNPVLIFLPNVTR